LTLVGSALSASKQKEKTKELGREAMPMTVEERKRYDTVEDEAGANDLVKRIRKLRWMGMEEEAERLQAELTRRCASADSVIATPRETD
jgi:hypothetical protein